MGETGKELSATGDPDARITRGMREEMAEGGSSCFA